MSSYHPKNMCNVQCFKNKRERYGNSRTILHFTEECMKHCCNLLSRKFNAHYGCVNAVEFSNGKQELLASGGDDKRVLLWNLGEALFRRSYKPVSMIGTHISNIFCLAFDVHNSSIFSSGNDEQVLVHDIATKQLVNVFMREDAVYSLSAHPHNASVFATAAENGRLHIIDMRVTSHSGTTCLANYTSAFHGVAFNPLEPLFVAGAHSQEGVALWDVRKPKSIVLRYGYPQPPESAMSVRFNETGTQLVVLRRRSFPRVYETHTTTPAVNCFADEYLNSCTMKSGCFAGVKDEYVVSGSDDFKIYVWKIPRQQTGNNPTPTMIPHLILNGHRSIVNQVRFNKQTHTLVSSGVEKSIHMWSPFKYPQFEGSTDKLPAMPARPLYSRHEYIDLVLQSGIALSHDYESENTNEDPRMMAFFDSLLQHDRNHSSDSSTEDEEDAFDAVQHLPAIMASSRPDRVEPDISSGLSDSSSDNDANSQPSSIRPVLLEQREQTRLDQLTRNRLYRLQRLRTAIQQDIDNQIYDLLHTDDQDSNGSESQQIQSISTHSKQPSNSESEKDKDCYHSEGNKDSGMSSQTEKPSETISRPSSNQTAAEKPSCVGDGASSSNNCKCDNERTRNTQSDTDSDDASHSNVRKRNAQRKRKIWKHQKVTRHPASETRPNSSCSARESASTNIAPQPYQDNLERTTASGSCSLLEDQKPGCSESKVNSAYESSRLKLALSIEATDFKLARLAQRLAEAIEEDEEQASESETTNSISERLTNVNFSLHPDLSQGSPDS